MDSLHVLWYVPDEESPDPDLYPKEVTCVKLRHGEVDTEGRVMEGCTHFFCIEDALEHLVQLLDKQVEIKFKEYKEAMKLAGLGGGAGHQLIAVGAAYVKARKARDKYQSHTDNLWKVLVSKE